MFLDKMPVAEMSVDKMTSYFKRDLRNWKKSFQNCEKLHNCFSDRNV